MLRFLKGLLVLLLLFTASTAVARQNIGRPDTIKGWLAKSGLYDKTVDTIIDNAPKEEGSLPLDQVELRKIANTVFSPQVLQNIFENLLDGTYHWLQGKVDKPDFRLDLTAVIESFKSETTNFLRQRFASLPNCPGRQIPEDTNPFTITCKPRGFDIEKELQNFNNELSKQEQLAKPVITADNLQPPGKPPVFETEGAKTFPAVYKFVNWAPFVFGLVSILLAWAILKVAEDTRHGLKTLGKIFASAAILVLINIVVQKLGMNFTLKNLAAMQGDQSKAAQELAVPLMKIIINDIARWNAYFVVTYGAIAAGIFGYLWKTKPAKK